MKESAGILLYRIKQKELQVLLAHLGGPFWKKKDKRAWSIPKGELEKEENRLDAAIREVKEETGWTVTGKFILLNPVRQKAGKVVHAWAVAADYDEKTLKSNSFDIEWPPRSGKKQSFPELDKADWFKIAEAKEKIHAYQLDLLEQLHILFNKGDL